MGLCRTTERLSWRERVKRRFATSPQAHIARIREQARLQEIEVLTNALQQLERQRLEIIARLRKLDANSEFNKEGRVIDLD